MLEMDTWEYERFFFKKINKDYVTLSVLFDIPMSIGALYDVLGSLPIHFIHLQ
jgi:hypothetical protein